MATRDRSQGIAFVYANPKHLYNLLNQAPGTTESTSQTVPHPRSFTLPAGVIHAEEQKKAHEAAQFAIDKLKANLNRLEEMQSRVRFMLSELEKGSKK